MRTFNLLSPSAICSKVGEQIKQCRLAKNISQQQLADMTQGSLSSIRRLEARGQGSLEFIVRVAQALQSSDNFENLFSLPSHSISDLERKEIASKRQRARTSKANIHSLTG
jgi:transcriptional regulator with XRE-family HTH domain